MKIQIEDSVFSCKRGVYGIFIIKNGCKSCSYVGKSEQLVIRAEKHKLDIENGKHVSSLIAAYKDPKATILISLLEEVPYCFDNYYKDAQRLASAENYWIDKYQGMNQCLEQVPEGKKPSIDAWENMKLYQNN